MSFSPFPRLLVRMALFVSIVLGGLLAGAQTGARAQTAGGLFSAAPNPSAAARPARANALRSRLVSADLGQIAGLDGSQPAERITLNLFDDVTYTAVRRESTQTGPGRFTWVGDLEGTPEGEIVLVVDSGALSAGIQDGQDFYEVRLAGDQLYWINLLNRNDTRDGLPPLVPDASASVLPAADPSLSPEGETIDVMVLYTPSAQTAAGGLAAMNALVDQAVADTNTAYANSDVAQRLRLVYKGAVSYTEQDFTNDLYALTFTAGSPQDPSGAIDSIHALRDTYHADLVSLLVNHSGGICGLGWLMSTASVSFESRGFNVVNYDCAVAPQNSFAHELGHNMGITHDKENAGDGVPSFAYSYGHQVPGQFRTVMAYVNGCASPCPRVRHFSNPNVTYNGFPTGTAANSASPAYNALSLDNTANTVASFRVAPVVATDRIYVPLMIR